MSEWDATPDYYTVEVGFFRPVIQRLERERGELAAAMRKVTKNLRNILRSDYETHDPSSLEALLERDGVLEAEALLKRIDEP